ncbi:DUF3865 domain-containing protein [Legionella resiliens]|uniref:DUF3865 domain-containing protein n=1 Tax=Legionella resiliens TaxID=2905958 RepID=A0ABS8X1Q1_9GAMM|nr:MULTISPECIES: DUF3865 domain-containing protein [unclassified Legionella]MCE0721859.1 DUF3865 domain-containing protein [Legionella sp. 9fVS26]MCE3531013.1 DUF3865 domain-containing protein [Legionella sp. 8cVS16]
MNQENILTEQIDVANLQFTSAVKSKLKDLTRWSEDALEWLMVEHYQFSLRNPYFLAIAANTTKQFNQTAVFDELDRNYNEEENHAKIYKKALFEIGTDVEQRGEFNPTTEFFDKIMQLISTCPSCTLGAMYATETAAIFEHEVFRDISQQIAYKRNKTWEKARLKAFHDMHLSGVEQSHKDELGKFVNIETITNMKINTKTSLIKSIDKNKVLSGAKQAIDAMVIWWDALLNHAIRM